MTLLKRSRLTPRMSIGPFGKRRSDPHKDKRRVVEGVLRSDHKSLLRRERRTDGASADRPEIGHDAQNAFRLRRRVFWAAAFALSDCSPGVCAPLGCVPWLSAPALVALAAVVDNAAPESCESAGAVSETSCANENAPRPR